MNVLRIMIAQRQWAPNGDISSAHDQLARGVPQDIKGQLVTANSHELALALSRGTMTSS
jgi:hypothetical protein